MAKYNLPPINHLPDEEPLDPIKEQAWKEVRQMFQAAPAPVPASGFGLRFQERLAADRRMKHRRQTVWMLAIMGGIAAALIIAWLLGAGEYLDRLKNMLFTWAINLLYLYAYVEAGSNMLRAIANSAFGRVAIPAGILLAGFATIAAVLWGVLYQKITSPRRIYHEDQF